MKQLFFIAVILVTGFSSFSFSTIKNDVPIKESTKAINYIQAYVVKSTDGLTLYFQQLDCAQNYINEFGGTLEGTARVKETQAFSCAF